MITEDLVDHDFLSKYCVGYDDATMPEELRGQGKSYVDYITGKGADKTAKTPEWASAITLVPAATIETLAREIAAAKPCAIYQGKGPQRRGNGEQTARAICMLAILTGNVGINGGNTGPTWTATTCRPTMASPCPTTAWKPPSACSPDRRGTAARL